MTCTIKSVNTLFKDLLSYLYTVFNTQTTNQKEIYMKDS